MAKFQDFTCKAPTNSNVKFVDKNLICINRSTDQNFNLNSLIGSYKLYMKNFTFMLESRRFDIEKAFDVQGDREQPGVKGRTDCQRFPGDHRRTRHRRYDP